MKRTAVRVVPGDRPAFALGVAVRATRQGSEYGTASTKNGEWPMYRRSERQQVPPLDQIGASNFSKLEVAWRFKTDNLGPRPGNKLEGTPIMVKGHGLRDRRHAPRCRRPRCKSGEMKWMYAMNEGERATRWAPRQLSGRGLSYWTDGRGDERILYVTTGYRLVELNARRACLSRRSGTNGVVDLKVGVVIGKDKQLDLEKGEIGLHSTPTVVNDTVIIGSSMFEGLGYRYPPTPRVWSAHSTSRPASRSGASTRFLAPVNSATTPGKRLVGMDRQRRRGTQISVDPRLASSTCPSKRRPSTNTVATAGQQPVRGKPRGCRPEDRCPQVALPDGAPRSVGPRQLVGLAADERDDQRPGAQTRGAADQTGLALRVRPHHGSADQAADPRSGRSADRHADGEDLPTQPIPTNPHPTAHLREAD